MEHLDWVDIVRQTGFEVHVYFKNGFLEKVYENALLNRLRQKGIKASQQVPLKVYDEDGSVVGEYVADILVENVLIIELKAAKDLSLAHMAQMLAYLKASKMKHGLLMNFGSEKFQIRKLII